VKMICFWILWLTASAFGGSARADEPIKNIKLVVSNPSEAARAAANVVIPISEIRKVAPDFKPGAAIVTSSDASTLGEDASILQTEELPSQVDDLDGDGKADELAFQINLASRQSRIVTISFGDEDRILRLRKDYKQRSSALFSRKTPGHGTTVAVFRTGEDMETLISALRRALQSPRE